MIAGLLLFIGCDKPAPLPTGPWLDLITTGCARTPDYRVTCWGNHLETNTTPDGREKVIPFLGPAYGMVEGLSYWACWQDGICDYYYDACWAYPSESGVCEREFVWADRDIFRATLYLLDDGTAWTHDDGLDEFNEPRPARAISGGSAVCIIDGEGWLDCLDTEMEARFREAGAERASAVHAARSVTCVVDEGGVLYCGGWDISHMDTDQWVQSFPELGRFRSIEVSLHDYDPLNLDSSYFACGVRTDGSVACWAADEDNPVLDTPSGNDFKQVVVGAGTACAVTNHGVIECWGGCWEGECEVPEGPV